MGFFFHLFLFCSGGHGASSPASVSVFPETSFVHFFFLAGGTRGHFGGCQAVRYDEVRHPGLYRYRAAPSAEQASIRHIYDEVYTRAISCGI